MLEDHLSAAARLGLQATASRRTLAIASKQNDRTTIRCASEWEIENECVAEMKWSTLSTSAVASRQPIIVCSSPLSFMLSTKLRKEKNKNKKKKTKRKIDKWNVKQNEKKLEFFQWFLDRCSRWCTFAFCLFLDSSHLCASHRSHLCVRVSMTNVETHLQKYEIVSRAFVLFLSLLVCRRTLARQFCRVLLSLYATEYR